MLAREPFELGAVELYPLHLANSAAPLDTRAPELVYASVRFLYLEHRNDELTSYLDELAATKRTELSIVETLGRARLEIRRHAVAQTTLTALADAAERADGPWKGELLTVLAIAQEVAGDDLAAETSYAAAAAAFVALGMKRRAANALMNRAAARSRIEPDRLHLVEFQAAARLALDAGDHSTAGSALSNLAREYQLLGANRAALREITAAIDLLQSSAAGTFQYYLALCNRCHILIELGATEQAQADFEAASLAAFPEVRAAVDVLRRHFSAKSGAPAPAQATSSWRKRAAAGITSNGGKDAVRGLESQLIELLAQKPHTKDELLDLLYAPRSEEAWFASDNRLRQLLHRIRRKRPGLVLSENGLYRLVT